MLCFLNVPISDDSISQAGGYFSFISRADPKDTVYITSPTHTLKKPTEVFAFSNWTELYLAFLFLPIYLDWIFFVGIFAFTYLFQ